ncbi:MAG TPA: asparagine synthase (glutamine-hydrolyzing) [Pyrinomonadaceae bacterium]|nr:asparagine synthase (glutamine-hydrolyzing) [Pyrinomonadaceae bacterium]
MCGIAGITGKFEARGAAARRMTRALSRRGPDAEGHYAWPRAALAHRRLAIFDLSDAGRQPMLSPDRAVGVVFNGAIYNFRELRAELAARGYEFRSQTDTEVLVHGYREWGVDGLVGRLHGMFAFALWDDAARKLFLVRDRLGVKPLAWAATDGGGVAFASTVRALREGGFVGELDERSVAEFLEFGFVTDARSIYRGARKVFPGTIVEFAEGREPRERRYWSPPVADESSVVSFDEAVEEAERLFLRAVELRLFADVPVGALLSGGVDSSLVCWAVAKLGGDVTAYTVGTPGDEWDETSDARATAERLSLRHRVLDLRDTDAPDVSELSAAFPEPFACASALGMLRVSQAVASEATVLLTGDGGDDVFLGYPEHKHFHAASKLAHALPGRTANVARRLRAITPLGVAPLRRASTFLSLAAGGLGAVAEVHDGLPYYRRHDLLGERLEGMNVEQRALRWSVASARRLLGEFLEYDRGTRFTGEYLVKVDGATMHHSLEARSPFLDQRLWEFAAALPYGLRLSGGRPKAILREIARRRVGEQVAAGRKRGFGVPVGRWVAGRWRARVAESLRGGLLAEGGWIKPERVAAQLERAGREGRAANQLWYLYALESWLRHERGAAQQAGDDPDVAQVERADALV